MGKMRKMRAHTSDWLGFLMEAVMVRKDTEARPFEDTRRSWLTTSWEEKHEKTHP